MQLGIHVAEQIHRRIDQLPRHVSVDPHLSRAQDKAPEHATQHVATAFVGRQHAVGDQERGGAAVLGDDPQGDVGPFVRPVGGAAGGLHEFQQRAHQIGLVERRHALGDHGQPFHAGTRVHVLAGQVADLGAGVVDLVLHEHVIPDLDEPFLVDGRTAIGPEPSAAVHEDLGRRTCGPRGMGPPVVLRPVPSLDPLGREADLLPDILRLVVVHVGRHPQEFRIDPEAFGDEFIPPLQRLVLEVVGEREVAEHLEHRQVTSRVPDVVQIRRAEALLHAGGTRPGRRCLP